MTDDLLADLLAQMERELFGPLDPMTTLSVDRTRADWLRSHRDEVLEALGGEQEGHWK